MEIMQAQEREGEGGGKKEPCFVELDPKNTDTRKKEEKKKKQRPWIQQTK